MVYRLVGFWVLKRAFRILAADDPRPLPKRLTHEARRILFGAAITLGLLILGAIVLLVLLVAALA